LLREYHDGAIATKWCKKKKGGKEAMPLSIESLVET
jgi:hypothetical protein